MAAKNSKAMYVIVRIENDMWEPDDSAVCDYVDGVYTSITSAKTALANLAADGWCIAELKFASKITRKVEVVPYA